ncbi:competence protein ComF [Schaalia sp. 19OD2882]|uniref:ComF family protein n=1 Tax=Schaalia sp. 19OD2882 TaxID=2794089 RepID=UPI001C1E9716|nr:competence protein ComF [Schaalia sp. 19OD2882]QWW20309.1 competence protein ComF [Schaalia sp. 19OD2882]
MRLLVDLALPATCPGCGQWDTPLCASCAARSGGPVGQWSPLEVEGRCAAAPLLTLGGYEGELRGLVLAAKHSARWDPHSWLERAGATLARGLVDQGLLAWTGPPGPDAPTRVWVVPAPSSWRRRLFGREVTVVLACAVARELAERAGVSAEVVEAAWLRPGARGQSGKTSAARRRGRRGAMLALVEVPTRVGLVLVDDVVTTGATARELARVLGGRWCVFLALARA